VRLHRSAGALLLGDGNATFFTDGRYLAQARSEVSGPRIVIARKSPALAAAEFLAESPHQVSAPCRHRTQSVTVAQRDQLKTVLKGKWKLVSAPALVEHARMVKDKEEIRRIRAAIKLGASLFQVARKKIRPACQRSGSCRCHGTPGAKSGR